MPQLVRVQNFMVSMDGFGAGEGQSLEAPFGHAEPGGGGPVSLPADLATWAFATASWGGRTEPGGSRGLDDYIIRDYSRNIGAEIMGRNKFGPQRGPWENLDWKGWWGDTPPFHTPVFVDGCSRLLDEIGDRVGLRHVDRVAARAGRDRVVR